MNASRKGALGFPASAVAESSGFQGCQTSEMHSQGQRQRAADGKKYSRSCMQPLLSLVLVIIPTALCRPKVFQQAGLLVNSTSKGAGTGRGLTLCPASAKRGSINWQGCRQNHHSSHSSQLHLRFCALVPFKQWAEQRKAGITGAGLT